MDARQKVCVFGECPAQISVIGAHFSFLVGLFNQDDPGELGRKPDFSDEVCIKEFVDFFFEGFTLFYSHLSFLL